jgi:hypothetical protein
MYYASHSLYLKIQINLHDKQQDYRNVSIAIILLVRNPN